MTLSNKKHGKSSTDLTCLQFTEMDIRMRQPDIAYRGRTRSSILNSLSFTLYSYETIAPIPLAVIAGLPPFKGGARRAGD